MTNKEKWAAQLWAIANVSQREPNGEVRSIKELSVWTLKSQMDWLKNLHSFRKDWKPQTLNSRPIYLDWPDFVLDKETITEFWRNENGETIKKRRLSIEEGMKEIEKYGKKALKYGMHSYEAQN